MDLTGRRFQIAGSASALVDPGHVAYAHKLIGMVVEGMAMRGCGFGVLPVREPRAETGQRLVFDWTVLQTLARLLDAGRVKATTAEGGCLVLASTTDKTERQIPRDRLAIWEHLQAAGAVEMRQQPPGRYFGATRREVLSEACDGLIAVSGGAGVEHLSDLYARIGKPVIPLDLQLGSSQGDGIGGAAYMNALARRDSRAFFRLVNDSLAGALLNALGCRDSRRSASLVADALFKLIAQIRNPRIFYVRLLNSRVAGFKSVDKYFREVVEPVVDSLRYRGFQAGTELSEHAWMNEEIFDGLRASAGAIVDLTGMRPNCYTELGFMLGQSRMTLVTAMSGTPIGFDVQQLAAHFWSQRANNSRRRTDLLDYWYRTAARPPIVRPRTS